ncbi:hypothetical protein Q7P37_000011 [Cladosporium fusiforme]
MQFPYNVDKPPAKKRRIEAEGREQSAIRQQKFDHSIVRDNARAHFGNQYNNYYGPTHQFAASIPPSGDERPDLDLMRLLEFDGMDMRRATIKLAYGNTCQWFFDTPEYQNWRDDSMLPDHHGFLWVRGKPGAGKSTLMKSAVRYADSKYPNDLRISFFFNAKGALLERSIEGMYRSLLCQLLAQCPRLSKHLHLRASNQQVWPVELLEEYFHDAVLHLGTDRLICYIDALDECGESDIRGMVEFFEDLGSTAFASDIRFHVFFTSRHYPHIRIPKCVHLALDNLKGHQDDIETYVRNKLKVPESTLREEFAKAIRARAHAVFLWVVLVMQLLNRESDHGNGHRLWKQLDAIPAGVHGLFEDAILRRGTDDTEYLIPTLLWMLFAVRLLSPSELYHAVVYASDRRLNKAEVHHHPSSEQMERFILNASQGLAEVTVEHNVKARRVLFIHETVREYLKDGGMGRLESSICNNPVGVGNDMLKEMCISYMSSAARLLWESESTPDEMSLDLYRRGDRVSDILPFLQYASEHMPTHAELAETYGISQATFVETLPVEVVVLVDKVAEIFPGGRYSPWVTKTYIFASSGAPKLLQIELSQKGVGNDNQLGVMDIVSHIVDDSVVNGGQEEPYGNPLQASVVARSLDTVRLLLENGADVNAEGGEYHTALQAAVFVGGLNMISSLDIARLLLEYGADVNAKGGEHHTALQAAVFFGDLDMIRLLLEYGADVNAEGGEYHTALQAAASDGSLDIVRLLFEYGADVNAKGGRYHTALHAAVGRQRPGVSKLLLESGADVNARDTKASTPLHLATFNGYSDNSRLLVEHGADVNAASNRYGTVLQAAEEGFGGQEIVEFLVECGAR